MEKPLAKLTKENHLNNLLDGLPLLTTLYGVNCLMAHYFIEGINIQMFALSLGFMLIAFVCGLFVYDKYHHVLLYDQYMLIYFQPLGFAKKIPYSNISKVLTVSEETQFSSLLIKLKSKRSISVHFVDHPTHAKKFIDEMVGINRLTEDVFDKAA
ncbi:MAG: hypothetical protein CME65_05315 [Halobacteriovoraceae bacterium]|nr:hypothetical protein [Halobacteriovoraceae bacterium]|tara:strand:+ start:2498 stop:2962 length:465 start_codon:yes stop_codon:yes gene_type:complete